MKGKKIFYRILIMAAVLIAIGAGFYFLLAFIELPRQGTIPSRVISPETDEYYGSSTYGLCQNNNGCFVSGCNSEICQSGAEEPMVSICVLPDKPTPQQVGYQCRCINQQCLWAR